MFRIGLVDLCTSHPQNFAPIINDQFDDAQVVAVWDGGTCRPAGYAKEFAEEHGIPNTPETLEELVESVDAGIIHSADWDLHLERARVFIEAGKPVLIDKPTVGNLAEVHALDNLQKKHDVPVLAGSSLRYAAEVQALKDNPELGEVVSIFASGPMGGPGAKLANYGIHTIEMFQGLIGAGAHSVRFVGNVGDMEMYEIRYLNGPTIFLQVGTPVHKWYMTVTTTTGMHTADVEGGKLYVALVTEFINMLRNGEPRVSLSDALEAVKVALAAKESAATGRTALLRDLALDGGFDGHAFGLEYAKGRL